jgi:hypothetical protein
VSAVSRFKTTPGLACDSSEVRAQSTATPWAGSCNVLATFNTRYECHCCILFTALCCNRSPRGDCTYTAMPVLSLLEHCADYTVQRVCSGWLYSIFCTVLRALATYLAHELIVSVMVHRQSREVRIHQRGHIHNDVIEQWLGEYSRNGTSQEPNSVS